ncbi:hypothetical protein [Sphingobium lignivorans]|uniref:Uncharacterized protein n=1 Tax=Sphingobium lignivorans TaxID=2735886 RepID=A0ABR6NFV3_9SPHN|nr:hypothetical protein [Sphingobium lignivorans]MBB5985956.1 hypothetical protein [Sphingobium lignivorans]
MTRNNSVARWLRDMSAASLRLAESDPRGASYYRGVAVLYQNRAKDIEGMEPLDGDAIARWFDERAAHRDAVASEDAENPESFHRMVAILYRARATDIRAGMDQAHA